MIANGCMWKAAVLSSLKEVSLIEKGVPTREGRTAKAKEGR